MTMIVQLSERKSVSALKGGKILTILQSYMIGITKDGGKVVGKVTKSSFRV